MPFFVKHYPYTKWVAYLVEADSLEAVENLEYDDEHEECLGEFIDISDEDCQIIGPFPTREAALIHARAYVDDKA